MITYRLAVPSDTPALISLLVEIMQHHGVAPPSQERLEEVVDAVFTSAGHCFLVADNDGVVVAMCALVFSYSTWSAAPACEVQDVVVTAEERRAGVGQGLIEAAADMARTRQCSRLFLSAESWNLEAHRFYRSLGLAEKTCLYFERDLRDDSR